MKRMSLPNADLLSPKSATQGLQMPRFSSTETNALLKIPGTQA